MRSEKGSTHYAMNGTRHTAMKRSFHLVSVLPLAKLIMKSMKGKSRLARYYPVAGKPFLLIKL